MSIQADDAAVLSTLADRLNDLLAQARVDVSRVECLDTEQRAEIYAILDALKSDEQTHRDQLLTLFGQAREAGDA